MKPNQLALNLHSISKSDNVRLITISPAPEYDKEGNKTGRTAGFILECLCELNNFEKIRIRVKDSTPVVTPEQLAESSTPIYVSFTDFTASLYFSNHTKNWEISAKAEKAQVVKAAVKA